MCMAKRVFVTTRGCLLTAIIPRDATISRVRTKVPDLKLYFMALRSIFRRWTISLRPLWFTGLLVILKYTPGSPSADIFKEELRLVLRCQIILCVQE